MGRSASVFAVIVAALVIGTFPILEKIVRRWMQFDEAYSHGFLIFGMSLYLLYRSWRERPPVAGFYPLWLVPLTLFIGIYLIAALLHVEAVQQFLLIPILFAAIATLFGFAVVRQFLLPIGLIVFALPFWDYSTYPLQLITTKVNEVLLGIWGIDFEVEGVLVFLPGIGAFEIAHGCSGVRYLLVAMALATAYSELNYELWRNRITLFAVAVTLALLTNWIRVFVIIYMGYQTNMESSLIEDHEFFGWVLFSVALVPLFFFAGRLERGALPAAEPYRPPSPASSSRTLVASGAVALLLLAPMSVYAVRGGGEVTESFSISLRAVDNWSPIFQRLDGMWVPDYAGEDHHSQRVWFKMSDSQAEELPDAYSAAHVLTYESQGPGKELISDRNRIVNTDTWLPEGNFTVEVGGETLSGLRLKDRRNGDQSVVIYGFYVSGRWAADPFGAKLLQLYSAVNHRQDASLVAVSVRCSECDVEAKAKTWAEDVMQQARSALDERFGGEQG